MLLEFGPDVTHIREVLGNRLNTVTRKVGVWVSHTFTVELEQVCMAHGLAPLHPRATKSPAMQTIERKLIAYCRYGEGIN